IKEALRDSNPWWKEEFSIEFKEREVYRKIQKFLPLPQIIALTGLRRVGKTTLMLKIVVDNIDKGFNPKNIIYFSFDNFRNIEIRKLIQEYEEIMEKDFRSEPHLLLLDEVQKLNNWEEQIKRVYDSFKNVKIIISGSESLFIKKKSKETLAGRIFEFKVEPLSFKEFLGFRGVKFEPIGLYETELIKLFNEFTLTQGFPELVGIKDKEIIRKYIQESIIEKIIYKDIPRLFKVRDASTIESLLNMLMEEPGQLIELSDLSKELNISRQTLSNYLRYLEESFLLKKLYNFSRSRRKVERKLKKYYPTIISTNLLFKEDRVYRSKVFECLLVNQLKAEFFWRDPYKNEVDVVMINKEALPVEIKYGKIDTKGILTFMKKFGVDVGYIISYKTEEKKRIGNKIISIIPAFKFLLALPIDI
ncbi:MAG: ATP-binding protein, partial [Candidatus Diapherotrites archaeon]|nr:ATP-binding protein [Candidatus Diapherotrites archaeon]